jgi:hypothetical protein
MADNLARSVQLFQKDVPEALGERGCLIEAGNFNIGLSGCQFRLIILETEIYIMIF